MMAAEIAFWVFAALLLYTYLGYPLLLAVFCLFTRRRAVPEMTAWPKVSVLVVAFNEEGQIRRKIENILACDYPADRLEVIVCSDGSTDRTNKIVEHYEDPRVKLAATQENHGVNEAFGNGARIATGELLLMTDSGGLFEPQALKTAIRHFADPKVGLVNGLFDHTNPEGKPVASGYRSYWAIETLVKLMEARLGLACVIVGAFEVIRRSLYWPIPSGLSNDMSVPMRLHAQGYKVIYEPRAIVRAPQKKRPKQEFQRRLRMAVRGWCTILPLMKLVPPWKTPINWLALLSHKYLRWLSGFFMAGMFAANVLLVGRPVFLGLFTAQAAFYAMAVVGWLLSKMRIHVKIFSLPFFFCILQMAAMAGFFQVLAGREIRTWKPTD